MKSGNDTVLTENGEFVRNPENVANSMNNDYVNVGADIGKDDLLNGTNTVNTINETHESNSGAQYIKIISEKKAHLCFPGCQGE